MAKFSSGTVRPAAPTSPIVSTFDPMATTHEGGQGYTRDPQSELFLLAVTNMVGESTFYETAGARDNRFTGLVHACVDLDPSWVARFVPYLRDKLNMRSASVVMAVEYVRAGGPNGKTVIDSACVRADEPAEVIGYYLTHYGRSLPAAIKRGVAQAAQRLYTERAALRYDGDSRGVRMADVIDLCHPKPRAPWQGQLFKWLLDTRHGHTGNTETLPMLAARTELEAVSIPDRPAYLSTSGLEAAGMSWESLAGWLQGPMDKKAWETVIPTMGYMALLRNLRNFDQAGVSDEHATYVSTLLSNIEEVAKSRQLPIRFYSAWKASQSMRWAGALERAVQHCLANVPSLPGKSLIMIDVSGSMDAAISDRSDVKRYEVAALFGCALALRGDSHTVTYSYANSIKWLSAKPGASLLRAVDVVRENVGGGTETMQCLLALFDAKVHDRVIILTDEQAFDGPSDMVANIPVPIYTFNLAGYKQGHLPSGTSNRYTFGGLTDAAFTMLPLLEARKSTAWPF